MNENLDCVGERISQKLKELNLRQVDVRKLTGLSKNAISNYISGNRIPDTTSAYKLSKLFRVSMEWLLTGEEPIQKEPVDIKHQDDELWPLSDEERNMLLKYRLFDYRDQIDIKEMINMKYNRMVKRGRSSGSGSGGRGSGEEAAAKEYA